MHNKKRSLSYGKTYSIISIISGKHRNCTVRCLMPLLEMLILLFIFVNKTLLENNLEYPN
ncbi:hypothetical protein TK11N_07650 [Tetragenococcus koreensis]|uniref:Uncharacterized protein n=1 Tax=Tetragenococcus koreensis TaxID=290335 RepID=A0ABQ0Y919_9ENTE|nr:hypothetical protein TK11N_07650 [Tetragenococcus koreensis]GEQ56265.1 hypothetical protein TK4N_06080 [Tetragenococcus koreensis]